MRVSEWLYTKIMEQEHDEEYFALRIIGENTGRHRKRISDETRGFGRGREQLIEKIRSIKSLAFFVLEMYNVGRIRYKNIPRSDIG